LPVRAEDDCGASQEDSVFKNVNRIRFGLGMLVVVVASTLLLLDVIESGAAAAIGFIGIVLLSTSGKRLGQT